MYRGRPPPRGGYPPPFEGRGPPPPRPYPAPGYRDDRSRPRPPYHSGYHEHGPPDPYRRSPPRRRYPSPGSGSHRGGEYRAGAPPTERPPSPRGTVPLDHNLVITVGNELTGPSGSALLHHLDRPEYEAIRGRSRPRSRSPDRSRARSLGRSKSRPRSQSRSPDRSRAKSRGRSRSRSPDRSRAKSRGRSRSRSLDRSRAKSRGRSRSRSPEQTRAKSRGRSPDRSRAKSRGHSRSRSPDRSRAKSRGRSRSRPCSRSKSRSRSRSRSRGRSRGRSYSKGPSYAQSKSRRRSRNRSCSGSSSSSLSSRSRGDAEEKANKGFKELEMARRRKELEELLTLPTKSILKKRNSEDSPSIRSTDSPRALDGSMSQLADQLLQAVKGTDPRMVASMLAELRSDPQMARRAGLDAEIKEILNLLGETTPGTRAQEKVLNDIDDEERFLYGDSEDPKSPPAPEPVLHHSLDLYGDVTEEALYNDYPPQKPATAQTYGRPLQAPSSMDVSYVSRPTINPDQNITVQVPNPSYPPGTEPLAESDRQSLEEYEKIQDLLKTIGVDLGVAEITKMAARTKERLHGSKPPPKTPTRRRQYSPDSSDGSQRGHRTRSHSGSSSSTSRSRSHGRGGSATGWNSDEDDHRKASAPPKSHKDRDIKERKGEYSDAAPLPSQTPDLSSHPPHPGVPIPTYPPSQVPGMMPPNYPPPGYGQYGNYLPYMPQQWPPMYPPPNIRMPPPTDAEEYPPPLPYKQAYTPEQGVKGSVKSVAQDPEKESSKALRVSEEQNNESQKQKVLVERENLKQEREIRMKKKEYLMKELERLRKQQGELLRKKRREKDGHKDPLLQEISHLQEEVMAQISNLRKEHEAAEKKRHEIEKVALILGLSPSDRPRRSAKPPEVPEAEPQTPPQKKKREAERSPDSQRVASGPTVKGMSATRSPSRASPDKTPVTAPAPTTPPEPFEYYDAGNHWCKNCNATCGSMFDFFTHLHSKTHRKTLDPYDRPWASTPGKISKNLSSEEKLTKPAKGSEFLLPIRGFFCLLCREFYGDAICAEEHVTTHAHNEKYKKQMYENPLYEQRRNLDRQAGLALEASAKKRKHDDDERGSKEDKTKHKKEKKEKEKKKEEDVPKEEKFKMKKEEEEDKLKLSKTEEDSKNASSLEKEWPSYSKKDEGEKYKYCKKDDKYRYSREEEERDSRYRYSREEEYRYRYDRDEDDRYSDRPKYGPKDDKDKYKGGKCSDFRSKYETERDEGKPKAEREGFKKNEQEKLAVSKPELPPKPYDLPKILCGPSPAMRAKLRKQSLEAGKPAPPATTTFGKFMWKKKENMLAKEAEKVAAEFIKEDEAAAKEKPVSAEDSFAKSMAVAKEIAEKLGSQPSIAAPWMSNRGRIRPNLPTPAVGLRKPTTMGRPASLNTFLSIRPQSTSLLGPPPVLPSAPTSFGNGLLQTKPIPPVNRPGPFEAMRPPVHKPALFQVRPPPPVSVLELSKVKPTPPPISELTPIQSGEATTPTQSEVNPASPVSEPATVESEPAPAEPKLLKSFEVNPAPPVSKPSPVDLKPVPVEAKPLPSSGITATPAQPAMIKIVSDVAAPGVPESEQIHTVFVKPPPFMKKSEVQKSDKFKRNLAAAKAQDLFDIFYSSVGQTGPSSFSKLASDSRTEGSSVGKSSCPIPQIPSNPQLELQRKPQPEPQSQLQSQPHSEPQSQPHPEPQCQPQLEPQSQPHAEPQPQLKPELESLPQSQSQAVIQFPPPTDVQKCPQRDPDEHPQSPLTPTNSGIQIASVWSLQSSKDSTSKLTLPNETDTQTAQPRLPPPPQFEVHIAPQNQSLTAKSDCQISPESQSAELQSQHKPASEIQTELQSEPDPNKDIQSYPEPQSLAESEHKPKPGPKIRGKTTPTKKTPSAPRPTRQTRSQTRYQTRQQQQQNQPEPEPGSASGDTAASDPKSLDTEDPGSGLRTEAVGPSEEDPQMMEITAETLGLPSDMTSLDFEYDFNFE